MFFFALLAMLAGATLFGYLMKKGVENGRVRQLAAIIAVLVWLSWITAAPIYMYEYGADKARIKAHPETVAAHGIGMEIKEHVFYTGLILATLIPIIAYGSDVSGNDAARRLLLYSVVLLILGGVILDGFGAWISTAAKMAYALGGG
ncbi:MULTISPECIES: hypothetical protein [unclassified Archaeoglobus]|jgi:uncharacterized membrane protein|uniref:hypothetical protein n=1 Tax=unclassified Archaeoglobus TaxID=2643606 RepID=UPI0025BD62CD|nr:MULTISPECIES: hypothetical protein [unclassified Archaeoglobus]